MIARTIAALVAAVALPAAAQTAAARPDTGQGKAAAVAGATKNDGKVTARERVRVAKAQNRDSKCSGMRKKDPQKKATAT
jgi:hypothetical protein